MLIASVVTYTTKGDEKSPDPVSASYASAYPGDFKESALDTEGSQADPAPPG